MKTLDKTRPFAEVCGYVGKARYEQDGYLFDVNGDCVNKDKYKQAEPVITETVELPKEEINEPVETWTEQTVEELALEMAKEGKSAKEIRKSTGLHQMKVRKIMADAKA